MVSWRSTLAATAVIVAVFVGSQARGQSGPLSITTPTMTFSQNFDALPTSGNLPYNQFDQTGTTLNGFFAVRTGGGTGVVVNDGSSASTNLYSYGTVASTDRALGSLGTIAKPTATHSYGYGVVFQNNTGSAASLNAVVSYRGEQWRDGSTSTQYLTFSYNVSNNLPTSSGLQALLPPSSGGETSNELAFTPTGFTRVTALDFASKSNTGAGIAVDGNSAAYQTAFTNVPVALNLANGQYATFYFADVDSVGTDHGLAIDDFSVTFTPVPVPEPATVLAASALGLGAVGLLRRRFKPAAA